MTTKAKRTQISDLRNGVTIYRVFALGPLSKIKVTRVASKPYALHKLSEYNLSMFIDVYSPNENILSAKGPFIDRESLKDMNIIPNDYNGHSCYNTLRAAKRQFEIELKREKPSFHNLKTQDYNIPTYQINAPYHIKYDLL